MAVVGLTTIYAGLKDLDGSVITGENGVDKTGIFEIDTDKSHYNLGSKTFNITNLSGTNTKISGNNEVVDISKGPAAPQVAIDSNMVNPIKLNQLLGRQKLTGGGWTEGEETQEIGLIGVSVDPITHSKIYWCFGRGTLTQATQNMQTNTDTAQTREDDNLTFTALSYDKFNKKPYAVFWEKNEGFNAKAMFDLVFPGQTLVTDSGTTTDGQSGTPSKA
ncbi:phage tail protein [Lactobacillus hominis]|uniref:Orf203 gp n=1 Tax=Lactobacillus hominis DSM 23910 = CRBIP 24.179 TaxID=1423758 RepID=I7JUR7_9LACO|nr:phage tail protein [Lactobacillus hominis]KRM85823.1 major tail protein [Lactobacillus hominis DSM 23910 = CRBIP 24.179]MCT3348946.1 phage tail protein [Lactobacillus hominis]CCI81636.1 Orf203 gp [Lactobacillus hominis DSM 23910 = CRBIP 24.179]